MNQQHDVAVPVTCQLELHCDCVCGEDIALFWRAAHLHRLVLPCQYKSGGVATGSMLVLANVQVLHSDHNVADSTTKWADDFLAALVNSVGRTIV